MSRMAQLSQKKRNLQDGMRGKTERPRKRFRKQTEYHSSSEDSGNSDGNFEAVNLEDTDDETVKESMKPKKSKPAVISKTTGSLSDEESEANSDTAGDSPEDEDTNNEEDANPA